MSKKLRVAIVGTGSRGVSCFTQIFRKRDDVEIAAFCDVNTFRARAAAEQNKITPAIYSSMEEMAQKETLDGVIITVPDCFHHDCAVKALKSGWNVLIDKPLAIVTTSFGRMKQNTSRSLTSTRTSRIGCPRHST